MEALHRNDNDIRVIAATDQIQIMQALLVRSAAFLGDDEFSLSEIFDGNDSCATHLIMYLGDEPIGSARLRFFNGFVKAERTGFRKNYRNTRYLRHFLNFMFDFAAQKGSPILLTYAEERYARLWEKLFGFEVRSDRPRFGVEGKETVFELIKRLPPHPEAITLESDPSAHFRIEGRWTEPSVFEIGAR